uniref:Scarecrow-like protein 3 n=1 Tax=Oryza barthii TaxID=65489 RepID=A0A0D3HR76_9ORYZ
MMHGLWVQDQGMVDHLAQLVPLLHECASHVTEGSFEKADFSFKKIRMLTIADGPLQHLSKIIVDSLAHRLLSSIQGLPGALIDPSDYFEKSTLWAARHNFFKLNPYLSTGFVTINWAIMEAMEDEKVELQVVHIVDLSCSAAHPWQWLKLLDDFHGRPGGAPELYLTVLHDDNDFLAEMQSLLSKKAESLEVSFRFISVIGRLETLDFSNLRSTFQIKFGVAVAISCALQMHRLLLVDDNLSSTSIAQLQKMANFTQPKQMASSVCSPASTLNYLQTPSPRTPKLLARLLSAIRALKPNIMVIMEQDADHNTLLFRDRFNEVLNYYAALFDCFHAVAAANPGRTDERLRVERMILREEIKNILVCEGVHRHERHERLDQWAMHMEESGFHNVQLSFSAIREVGLSVRGNSRAADYIQISHSGCSVQHMSGSSRGMFQDDMLSSATSSPASSVYSPSPSPSNGSWVQELSHDQQSVRLIGLLYQCAAEVSAGSFDRANLCLEHITQLASLDAPHALQRLAAVFADALARKLLNLIPGLSRALLSSANSADAHLVPCRAPPHVRRAPVPEARAMEGERFVHLVDFSGPVANPVQWIALFHAFRGRREGPPHLRITAVHDSKEFLANMAAVLSKEAEAFDIAFQFNAVEAKLDEMDFDALRHDLGVRSGEALAVSVVLQLHRLLAVDDGRRHAAAGCLTPVQIIARSSPRSFGELLERELNTRLQLSPDASVVSSLSPHSPAAATAAHPMTSTPKLGSFLSAVRSLSPKIMVMTEQEANHNGGAFQERFDEALNYYASLFDCLQRSAAAAAERARVERVLLGEEIRGVVACEGAERTERHERARQWAARMEAAGMESVGLSYSGAMEARKLLQSCGWAGPYEVRHDAGGHGFFFCWHKRPLYAVTAWRPAASRRGHTRS